MDALLRDYPEFQNLDRLGGGGGEDLTVQGTPFEQRGLTPGHTAFDYNSYNLKDMPAGVHAEVSIVAPANGFPGGGWQIRFKNVESGEWISLWELDETYGMLA